MTKHLQFKKALTAILLFIGIALRQSAFAQTFTIEESYNSSTHKTTFTIKRSGSSLPQQTIKYRTVNLSAYAGQHYTAVSGDYTFPANETTKTVEVTESSAGTAAYQYQSSTTRSYRFEVLDINGFELQHYDRSMTTGAQFSADKVSKEITDLVYFNGSTYASGLSSGKYLDVSFTPPSGYVEANDNNGLVGYVLIDDSYDYATKPATVSTSTLISSTNATASYLNSLGYKIYATVCFSEKERDDGYQYVQILAGASSASYDGADPNGSVNDPSYSVYKACFELADGANSTGKAFFPHRYDCETRTSPTGCNQSSSHTEFNLAAGKLWKQKYKSGYQADNSGSLVFNTNVANITTRFDAAGDNDDTWGYKDLFVRMALLDATSPTLLNNSTAGIAVSAGPYIKGNTFYISVPFNEIVHVSGAYKQLYTSWGNVEYVAGDNTNVITYKGTINATAGTTLAITGIRNSLFNDLAGNYFQGSDNSFNKTFSGVTCTENYILAVTNTSFAGLNGDYWVSDGTVLPQPHPTVYFYKGIVNTSNRVQLTETTNYTLAWTNNTSAGDGTVTTTGAGIYSGSVSTTFPIRWATYTVSFHGNGSVVIPVTGTMSDQAFTYNTAQNLTANAFSREGFTFAGWNTAPDGSGTSYTNGQSVNNLTPDDGGTIDLYAQWTIIPWTGNGSSGSPYLILYPSQLDLLASNVNGGNDYSGMFFKLGNDITYGTTGLGENESNYTAIGPNSTFAFDGTFDGNNKTISGIRIHNTNDCHGLFGCVGNNGNVKNVVLANSIITGKNDVGGIAGWNEGILTNCRVEGSVEVLPIDLISLSHGGIVGENSGTISGCISAASVNNNGINNVRYYGGIVGRNTSAGTVKDCLYTGSTVNANNYYGAIAGTNSGTLTNNYYTNINLGGVGGSNSSSDCDGARRARVVTLGENVALVGDETAAYNLSGLTAIGTGSYALHHGSTIYSGATQTLTFNYTGGTVNTGYDLAFTYNDGSTHTISDNSFEMPASDVTVNATVTDVWGMANGADGSEAHPYIITTTTGLDLLAKMVNGTDGYTANTFQGKHFKLGNDITYSTTGLGENESNYTAIGNGSSKYFQGTFDGDGKTISGIRIYTTDGYQGLFGYVYNGTVKNVILANSIITGGDQVGGIVGNNHGIVTNCIVESSVTINAGGSVAFYYGGIVGTNSGTVSGCISAATVSNNGYGNCRYYGGIVGKNQSSVKDCLYTGTSVTASSYYGSIVGQNDSGILTNNYYTAIELGGVGGNGNATVSADTDGARRARTITLGENVVLVGDETEAYNLSGLTAIGTGNYALRHGSTIYSGATQNVTLNYTGTIPEGYRFTYYTVNNEPVEGNTFEMPAADAVVEAVLLERYYTYNSTTGELALIFGEFNSSNKWGNDVTPSAVTSVTATDEVSFTGDCSQMFSGFSNCTSIDLSQVNTDECTNMAHMFYNCSDLTTLDVANWNTASVTDMNNMFYYCSRLTTLDVSNWNTASVTDMSSMFNGCWKLSALDVSNFNTANVTDMNRMFYGCSRLTTLDVSNWNTANVTNMYRMFYNCTNLTTIYVGSEWNTENVVGMGGTFGGCTNLVGGNGTAYDPDHVDAEYARFDQGADDPGYLTGVFTITLPEGVTTTATPTLVHGDVNLYAGGSDITLTYGGEVPEGYAPVYSVNGTAIEGNTFTMPFEDASVTVDMQRLRYIFNSTTGELALIWGEFNKDDKWGDDVPIANVTSVTATDEVSFTGDCTDLFAGFSNCTSMDLSQVNTDNVTNMIGMFAMSAGLETLNLSGWNTANVTNMYSMFATCTSLTTIEGLSDFNTANVTNMNSMFNNCSSLTTLDLSNWNTANVTSMVSMFHQSSGLETINISNWDVSNVTEMATMFLGCSSLESLDIKGWDVGNVTNMGSMIQGCQSLDSLDLSGWNTANVTSMNAMFLNCSGLQSLDLSGWNVENASLGNMFTYCSSLTTVDVSNWTIGNAYLDGIFASCQGLTTLDLSTWNTESVTHMNGVFSNCPNLTTIYVGEGWSTENVTSSGGMFAGCTNLVGGMGTEYDPDHIGIEYARMDHGEDEPGYLTGVFALTLADDITATPAATLVHDSVNLYAAGHDITLTYNGEIPEGTRFEYFTVNGDPVDGDTFTMPFANTEVGVVFLAPYSFIDGVLSLNYGEFNKDNKWGSDVTPSAVTSVTATDEVSFTGDCWSLFDGFSNCASMDLNNANTEGVTNMAYMFSDCTNLDTLDLSGWNIANVTILNGMFNHCTNLKTLNLTGWDVSHVTDMPVMFSDCRSLTTIEGIKQWNTSNVTSMNTMFRCCKSLKSLDLSDWNTESLTNMNVMFMECDSLQTLNLSGWDVSNITSMNSLFWGCKSLETLDVSGWDVSNVTNMGSMFYNCSSLTAIHRSEWNTENVTDMQAMFYRCSSLETLDLSDWNTENVTNINSMFTYCSNLTTIYVGEGWSTENVTTSGGMFFDCTSLVGGMGTTYNYQHTDGDYAHIDYGSNNPGYLSRLRYTFDSETGTLALLYGLFNKDNKWGDDVPIANVTSVTATNEVSFTGDCTGLFGSFSNCTSMNLSNVNTEDCTNMSGMFAGCTNLSTIEGISDWDVSNVTDMVQMFVNCQSLKVDDLSSWDTGNVTSMSAMFHNCSSLEALNLSGWDLSNVTDMSAMFFDCTNLTTLDFSGWKVGNISNMGPMFNGCTNLTSLDVSNWTIGNANLGCLFMSCTGIETLDLSTWDTSNVTIMLAMFSGCSNLTTIYVGEGWSVPESTGSMFGGCTSLVGGMGTTYDPSHTNGDYAHIDGGPNNPGYLTAIPLDPVEYIDANGQTAYCQYYTILNGSEDYISYGDNDVEAWYVVDHDVTYSGGIWIYGPTNLILVDGATLTINDDTEGDSGYMSSSDRLTIYVQSNGTGAITAVNSSISASGDLIIHGGHITLSSDNSQAYTYMYSSGDMTINGGAISIENGNYHCIYASGQLTINEGTLNAVVTEGYDGYDVIYSEEDVVINGGNITVTNQGYGRGIVGDNVTINGGSVKVYIAHEDDYSGIATDGWGGITLGWTDASDRIMSEGGYNTYQLNIATDQAFTDGEGNYYFGTYYLYEMPDLAGKTLVPFTNLDETFHITYVTNGGTLPDGYPTTYTFGETVVLPIPTKEDNAFAGWFDNAEFDGYPVTEIVAGTALGNKTFYAKWMPAKTWVDYLDADGQQQRVYATVLYGIETELPGGVYTIVDDGVSFDKLSFTGTTTIILPDNKYLYVECMGKGTNDDEYSLFVNGDLTIYGQEHGDGVFDSYNVQVSGDVAIYGGSHDIGYLSANNGSGTITLSWTALGSSIRVYVYLGNVVLAKAFIDDDDNIHKAGTVANVTTINGQYLYPFITETEVSYLDENGVLQTVTATVLYGGEEAEYPEGVYTVLDMVIRGQAYYDRLHFIGDATIIIPDWCSFGVAATKEDNEYWMHVDGNLTIYGQEYGNGECLFSNVTVNGHVNVYGGKVVLYNISANEINLSWTSIQNEFMVYPTQGTVNLLKDFMYYDDDHNRHVINAQQNVDITTIAERYLKPYAETIDVSYIDENGDAHTENATVLFGDETSLSGGTYTIINYTSFSQAVSFSGNTKLIIPDGIEVYGYYQGGGINLNVTGDLAIYGQENRSGTVLYINASVSGAVTVSNVRVIYSFINSESDILIAGGEQNYGQLSTNGIITLGYLTFNDQIFCYDYEGTVAIREGLTMINDGNGKTYTGTLTAEKVAEIENNYLYPYLTPINLEVAGYGESTESDHWVFIASPIAGSIYADNVTNLIGGMTPLGQYDYDLYRFNQSADKEWENYQQHNTMSDPFLLENGKGYLYANKYDVTLKFGGAVYPAASKEVALDYDANATFAGWNLVGNPFNAPAILDKSYYKMNTTGTGLVAEALSGNTPIDALTGVMVQAEGEDETVLFTKSDAKGQHETGSGTLQIALTQGGTRGNTVLDNAIVSFNENDQLGKFYFLEQDANIYIPKDNEEYAIAYSNGAGEMPLNFKARKNGTYTLTVSESLNSKFLILNYLHLIDNLTGANIDLLQTPSYTFTARSDDYASRFKLVFSTGSDADDDFAFISNGEIIVNGEGVLQVIDVLGHVIVCRDAMHCVSTTGMTPGVYVLRLINGENVKTQKMVIQ